MSKITTDSFIPRYIEKDGIRQTLRDIGWKLAYINPDTKEIIWQSTHLVHYCKKCKQQRTFTITGCLPAVNKNGYPYISGYYGFCNYCNNGGSG